MGINTLAVIIQLCQAVGYSGHAYTTSTYKEELKLRAKCQAEYIACVKGKPGIVTDPKLIECVQERAK
jgi:hypothetical protein